MTKFARHLLICISLVALSGCAATPDISTWADNSTELAATVASENNSALERLDDNIGQLEIGEKEGWRLNGHSSKQWQERRDSYVANVSDVNAVMDAMVLYANAIAELAAAGETGEESVKSAKDAVTSIADTVGVSVPISQPALAVLKTFAEAWTRAEAQESLAEAMIATDPEVKALADHIAGLLDAQRDVVNAIDLLERRLIRQRAGPERMSWYVKNEGYLRAEEAFGQDTDVVERAATTYLLTVLEERFRDREKARSELEQWRTERLATLDSIERAVEAWRNTHLEAARFLQRCAGFRSLRNKCGTLSAAHLRLAIKRIQTAIASDASGDAE